MPNNNLDTIVTVKNTYTEKEFTYWKEFNLSESFLTPCSSFSLTAGADIKASTIAKELPEGAPVQILINGNIQLTGYVDGISVKSSANGSNVSIRGRDFLSTLVDGNIDPNFKKPKDITIDKLVRIVLTEQFDFDIDLDYVNDKRQIATGKTPKTKSKPTRPRTKENDPLKNTEVQGNEGAFQYLSRILTYHGYWLRASPDGKTVILAGPDYDQDENVIIWNKYNQKGDAFENNVIESELTIDGTHVPSDVMVRGRDSGAGKRGKTYATISNPLSPRWKPVYIQDDLAKDQKSAETIAKFFLSKQMRGYLRYHAVVQGFKNEYTQEIYNVDTKASVFDEVVGTQGYWWIETRNLSVSESSGAVTSLEMIPPYTLVLDWQPDETLDPPRYWAELLESIPDRKALYKGNKLEYSNLEVFQ